MVKYQLQLNMVFQSLADPTRRDILKRVAKKEMSIGEIASPYHMSFAAISKHLKVLESAELITKRRDGKQQFVQASPLALKEAMYYLEQYKHMWEERFDRLDALLEQEKALRQAQGKKQNYKSKNK
jgi:DNA-binding transcriptional ArsR family regulator